VLWFVLVRLVMERVVLTQRPSGYSPVAHMTPLFNDTLINDDGGEWLVVESS